ncbi:hypothetical protein GCM10009804_57620 [Kribbella hippodromi]|uniref:Uncharacterized protein n=1 Tax=Kribbella hippodromi TaxID=434347 RepID=A0ABN2E1R6_9ACTN
MYPYDGINALSNVRSSPSITGRTFCVHGPWTLRAVLLLSARTLVTASHTGDSANLIRPTSPALNLIVITGPA